ncbi:MAG: hypothetical protein IJW73_09675 [Candidatus Gastranaerophilales bacterium]|nr:hypothetical protein [Candidatus Gastranaerophilales bacterium]
MIQRLAYAPISFKANEATSPRDAYDSLMNNNVQTAQKQNKIVAATNQNTVPMQGAGQKLDVIA